MKNKFIIFLVLAATTSLFAACSDRAKKDADPVVSSSAPAQSAVPSPTPVPTGSPGPTSNVPLPGTTIATTNADPFVNIAIALDETTRDTTSRLSPQLDQLNRVVDAQINAWKAAGSTSTPMGEEKLAMARSDFAQKLRDLSLQPDETWKNAKGSAQVSLQNLRKVYADYLAGPSKN